MLNTIIAFLISCFLFLSADSEFQSWTEEHNTCTVNLPSSLKSCSEMPYIKFVRHELSILEFNPEKNWRFKMLKAINNLYIDLNIARVPSVTCITQCNNGSTENNSRYVYPISFSIPERFITDTVPYKVILIFL